MRATPFLFTKILIARRSPTFSAASRTSGWHKRGLQLALGLYWADVRARGDRYINPRLEWPGKVIAYIAYLPTGEESFR